MRRARTGNSAWTFLFGLLALVCSASLLKLSDAVPAGLPAGVWTEDVVNGVGIVSDFEFLGPDRIAVVRKNGIIDLYKNYGNGFRYSNVLLDLRWQVVDYGDRGAMGILKHYDFDNGVPWIYVSIVYDDNKGDPAGWKKNRLLRYAVYGDYADASSMAVILGKCNNAVNGWYGGDCSPMLGTTHSIGWMGFGSDRMLYVAVGEGQTQEGGDWTKYGDMIPTNWALAMDPNFLGGKILRLDPDTGLGLPSNPFWDGNPDSSRSRVWSVGLRNPFKCSFTPEGNQVICGNVGWYLYESVIVNWRGSNAGWPCYEGNTPTVSPNQDFAACQSFYAGTSGLPGADIGRSYAFVWSHEGVSAAAIGGSFFPNSYPAPMGGSYLFADFSKSLMFLMGWNNGQYGGTQTFAWNTDNPVAMRVSPYDGRMYYLGHCTGCGSYGVLRVFNYAGWKPVAPPAPPAPPPPPPPPPVNGIKGWFCSRNITSPIRMENGDAVCMAAKATPNKCVVTANFDACLQLANNPPADAVSYACGATMKAATGNNGYTNPKSWCGPARSYIQSVWSCIPKQGLYIPIKMNTEGSASCMSTNGGQSCAWAGPLPNCYATAAQPPANITEKKCDASLNSNLANICGAAWSWLNGSSVPIVYPWKCLSASTGVKSPVFVRNGNVYCMSTDGGKSCALGVDTAACNKLIQKRDSPALTIPKVCNVTDYQTQGSVCNMAFRALGQGWNCIAGVNTPVKLDLKANAMCLAPPQKARADGCTVTPTLASCFSAVLNQPASIGSVSCTYMMYTNSSNSWCPLATTALNGKVPFPPASVCYNKNIQIPPLPAGWSTIMRPNVMPGIVYAQNGPNAGPVEIDASVGGTAAVDGAQITIGGNRYSYGLGVRAISEVRVTFKQQCYAITAQVGVDDETNGQGVGEFIVRSMSASGTILANSTQLNGGRYQAGGAEPFPLTVTGLNTLMGVRLQAIRPFANTYRGGNIANDHLDWGDIRFLCGPDAPYLPQVAASVTFISGGTGNAKRVKVGDKVAFSGSAIDWQGKPIPATKFEWFVNLVHCQGPLCHTHFVQQIPAQDGLPGVAGGTITIDDHPLDGNQYFYFQIRFAATDACGRRNYVDKNLIVDVPGKATTTRTPTIAPVTITTTRLPTTATPARV